MNTELLYRNLIEELDKVFPGFTTYLGENRKTIENNKSVYFTFFCNYVRENWFDTGFQNKVADFMERMRVSKDEDVQLVFDDFILDFYSSFEEHGINVEPFLKQLSPATKDRILNNYNYWLEANRKVAGDSR